MTFNTYPYAKNRLQETPPRFDHKGGLPPGQEGLPYPARRQALPAPSLFMNTEWKPSVENPGWEELASGLVSGADLNPGMRIQVRGDPEKEWWTITREANDVPNSRKNKWYAKGSGDETLICFDQLIAPDRIIVQRPA